MHSSVLFYLKLSQVPHFQDPIVPSWQEEWFAPVPADHIHIWRVSFIGWQHWIGRGTDIPDTNRLIHWTGCKNLWQTRACTLRLDSSKTSERHAFSNSSCSVCKWVGVGLCVHVSEGLWEMMTNASEVAGSDKKWPLIPAEITSGCGNHIHIPLTSLVTC